MCMCALNLGLTVSIVMPGPCDVPSPCMLVLFPGDVPPGCYVRAYLVFRDPSVKEVVQRCAKHQSEDKGGMLSLCLRHCLCFCFVLLCVGMVCLRGVFLLFTCFVVYLFVGLYRLSHQ